MASPTNYLAIVLGTVLGSLVMAIIVISLLVVWSKIGVTLLHGLPLPPNRGKVKSVHVVI